MKGDNITYGAANLWACRQNQPKYSKSCPPPLSLPHPRSAHEYTHKAYSHGRQNKGQEVTSQRNRDAGMGRQERVIEGPEIEDKTREKQETQQDSKRG
jgi:hypothetical protein